MSSFNRIATGTTLLGLLVFIVVAHHTQPSFHSADLPTYLTLLALFAFTEFFPLKRNELTISLSMSVELLIFVKFGIVPIVLASQVLFILSRLYREKKLDSWRTVANMGMFLLMTSGAAGAYYLAGGTNEIALVKNLLPLLAYIVVHFLMNHTNLYMYFLAMSHFKGIRSYLHHVRFDMFSTLFASSLGLVVLLLFQNNGLIGLLSFGFPMVLCVYVFKLFNDVSRSSGLFRNLANLTGDFSGELEIDTIVTQVTEELPKWFNEVSCLIFVHRDGKLVPLSVSQECPEATTDALLHYLQRNEAALQQPFAARRLSDEPEFSTLSYHGLLVAPFQSDQSERGFCCLLARRFNEFDARTLDAVSVLANQLTVSFRNAMRYETVEKQSLYDELTQLPNHRFCERRLSEEVLRFECNGSLSLLLIDLDHFKKVNDTYGHLAGNVVLNTVARTFEK
ncbi:MAG: GGDEF domain-containing protein, partial [Tumebacillaceae bacterium]